MDAKETTLDFPPEVWAHIVSFLERPKPRLRTKEWSKLHQEDLATMMRVSKMHFHVTASFLYREPIVENVWSFLQCSDLGTHPQLPPYSHDIHDDPSEKPPIDTTKAYCYKHVQRIHLILTEASYSFNYWSTLFVHHKSHPHQCWELIDRLERPANAHPESYLATCHFTDLVRCYGTEIQEIFDSATHTGTHRHLRPKSLSFGTYGDVSWNARQTAIDDKPKIKKWVASFRRQIQKDLETMLKDQHSDAGTAGCYNRMKWSKYKPESHCTRFYGGPYGVVNQPIMNWQISKGNMVFSDSLPKIVFIHIELPVSDWGITIGAKNVVIFHPGGPGNHCPHNCTGMVTLIQDFLEHSQEQCIIPKGYISATTIDIYAEFVPSDKRKLKLAQQSLDQQLDSFKGQVTLHPYIAAPPCPCCGWCHMDDEEDEGLEEEVD